VAEEAVAEATRTQAVEATLTQAAATRTLAELIRAVAVPTLVVVAPTRAAATAEAAATTAPEAITAAVVTTAVVATAAIMAPASASASDTTARLTALTAMDMATPLVTAARPDTTISTEIGFPPAAHRIRIERARVLEVGVTQVLHRCYCCLLPVERA
jgi:hypothetical protein